MSSSMESEVGALAVEGEDPRSRVLLVEDDAGLRELLAEEIHERGFEVRAVESGERGIEEMQTWWPDLVISDLKLPGMSGIDLLQLLQDHPAGRETATILITAFGSVSQAVEALKLGADDFITKPLDLDHMVLRVERLLELQRLRRDVLRYRQMERGAFHGMVGRSAPMRALVDEIRLVSEGRGSVLILGESGVGKELVARAIHLESRRAKGPFVAVNCASIPANLTESELFGHDAGAFTGATKSRKGLFESADGGTLLLDEVGELPLEPQAKLLRVLQESGVRRVGGNRTIPFDVRVLVATNRDLAGEVAAGRFRSDLYYRLATFTVRVPPLRARRSDLPVLAALFLNRFCEETGKAIDGFDPRAFAALRRHTFPGNVRELANVVEHAATYCQGNLITEADLPEAVRGGETPEAVEGQEIAPETEEDSKGSWVPRGEAVVSLEEVCLAYVRHVLEVTGWNKRRAAALLGISRRTLYRYLDRMA